MWHNVRLMNAASAALLALALLLFAVGAVAWLAQRPMFRLQSVLVEAEHGSLRHVNAATIRAAAVGKLHGNFFTVNLEGVRSAFESVAWVRHARVRREWPNRLVVKVEEHQAFANWEDGRLVNNFGELFTANPAEAEDDGDLPELGGPAGSEKDVTQRYRDFTKWFARIGLKPDQVTLSPRYAWSVHLDNGTESGLQVEFGREKDAATIPERVNRMLAAYPLVTARWPKLTLVDLRYPNGFALRAEGLRMAEDAKSVPRAAVVKPKKLPAPAPLQKMKQVVKRT